MQTNYISLPLCRQTEQCIADWRCLFTPRLAGVGRKHGNSLKLARVFPSENKQLTHGSIVPAKCSVWR